MTRALKNHEVDGVPVHLFVQASSTVGGETAPFLYLGEVSFRDWRGDKPITVTLELEQPVPEALWGELGVGGGGGAIG
ncbi:MAG: DUF3427 domain-containing protein [Myxococcales bacterium]|nr:DUF3427 domain-containing protein [Myxococcales bacterium]